MPSRSNLEIKSRLVLGIGLLGLVVVLLLRLLLPLLAIVGLGAFGFWLWRSHRKKQQQQQRQQARINAKFYQLLQQQQGRISVLDFAMRTQLDGAAAQAYLNAQAQAFSAFFETTPQGDLIYVFSSAAVGNAHREPEAAWTYAEQAKADQAHAEKAHAAWSNARQIRTLRQLSQNAKPQNTGQDFCQPGIGAASPIENRSNLRNDAQSKIAISANLKASSSSNLTKSDLTKADSGNLKPAKKPVIKLPKESGYPETGYPKIGYSKTERGRAYSADDRVVTIDVTATRS